MNKNDNALFETELRKLRPAPAPEALIERLASSRARVEVDRNGAPGTSIGLSPAWLQVFRGWLTPALCSVAIVVGMLGWKWYAGSHRSEPAGAGAAADRTLQADRVEIDRQLIASFEAVASLSDGEPVLVRCNEWEDKLSFRDSARGVTIERRTPRLEVVPVRLETY